MQNQRRSEPVRSIQGTAPNSKVEVDFSTQRISLYYGYKGLYHTFGFPSCIISAPWFVNYTDNRVMIQKKRAVLTCSSGLYKITLEPKPDEEAAFAALYKVLEQNSANDSIRTPNILLETISDSMHKPRVMCPPSPEQVKNKKFMYLEWPLIYSSNIDWGPDEQISDTVPSHYTCGPFDYMLSKVFKRQPTISMAQVATDPIGFIKATSTINSSCSDPFGPFIKWCDEPIFLVQLITCRHGENDATSNKSTHGSKLTNKGISQSYYSSRLLEALTGNYMNVAAIWSSRQHRSAETADIIQNRAMHIRNGGASDETSNATPADMKEAYLPRVINDALSEYVPPYMYRLDGHKNPDAIRGELKTDGRKCEGGRMLLSAALRCRGSLVPHSGDSAADICIGTDELLATMGSDNLRKYRAPPVPAIQRKVLGVYVGHAPAMVQSGSTQFIYVGHSLSLRYQICAEVGFPPDFWRKIHISHGAVNIVGLTPNGDIGMIIGDAGALTVAVPQVPITFTPRVEADILTSKKTRSQLETYDPAFTNDSFVEPEWYSREILPGIFYNAPSLNIPCAPLYLIRHGQNIMDGAGDQGLTDIGKSQMEVMSTWLARYIDTNDKNSDITKINIYGYRRPTEMSRAIEDAADIVHKIISDAHNGNFEIDEVECVNPTEDVISCLNHPIFGEATVIISDEITLLRTLGYLFRFSDSLLERLHMPHAGILEIGIGKEGWSEISQFGMISHIVDPDHITTRVPRK